MKNKLTKNEIAYGKELERMHKGDNPKPVPKGKLRISIDIPIGLIEKLDNLAFDEGGRVILVEMIPKYQEKRQKLLIDLVGLQLLQIALTSTDLKFDYFLTNLGKKALAAYSKTSKT